MFSKTLLGHLSCCFFVVQPRIEGIVDTRANFCQRIHIYVHMHNFAMHTIPWCQGFSTVMLSFKVLNYCEMEFVMLTFSRNI